MTKKNRKTNNEPSRTFLRNAFEMAKEAGWKRVIVTTPYGTVEATDDASLGGIMSEEPSEWNLALEDED